MDLLDEAGEKVREGILMRLFIDYFLSLHNHISMLIIVNVMVICL